MTNDQVRDQNLAIVKTLTYLMFAMFAMTTDSVGVIIPEVIRTLRLSLTAAGTFQYATMTGIAVAGFAAGIARRSIRPAPHHRRGSRAVRRRLFSALGRKYALVLRSPADAVRTGDRHLQDGRDGADRRRIEIDRRTHGDHEHAGRLLRPRRHRRARAADAAPGCRLFLEVALCHRRRSVRGTGRARAARPGYPEIATPGWERQLRSGTAPRCGIRYVLAFSAGAFLYVAVEAAIYVWMPTLLARYTGSAAGLAAYSLSVFFLLRAAGRFLGAWMLRQVGWQLVLMVFSGCILACFALTVIGGVTWAAFVLPLSGLFMSVMYPTINSKGISCVQKRDHGAAAGVILFFTCVSAVVAPLMIGAAGDAFGDIIYGYRVASGFAALLFGGSVLNWAMNPTRAVLDERDLTEHVSTRPAARPSV